MVHGSAMPAGMRWCNSFFLRGAFLQRCVQLAKTLFSEEKWC
jgi:hypothetical protein